MQQEDGTPEQRAARHQLGTAAITEALRLSAEAEVYGILDERSARRAAVLQDVFTTLKDSQSSPCPSMDRESLLSQQPRQSKTDRSCQVCVSL